MITYIYDGSFEGILTSIYESYYRKELPEKIISDKYIQQNIFFKNVHIETDLEKSKRVYKSIIDKISHQALRHVYNVYLSEVEDSGTIIYNYLSLGWKIGSNVDLHITDDWVHKTHTLSQRVGREKHLLLGILRFRLIGENIYYGPVKPQYNTIGLLAPHFAKRLAGQNWMIHDTGRNIAIVYNQEEWFVTDVKLDKRLLYNNEEKNYQELWKEYFNTIAIKERTNPRAQQNHMPKKYWSYLIEKA